MKAYMGLTCKPGTFNTVLKELLRLFIDPKDIFLLFGPIDIFIRFVNLKDLEEFISKWFNTIRVIGAEEGLITETLSLIVGSEGPLLGERPFAFVFINAEPRNLENVKIKLLSFPEVVSADIVFGPYDIICGVKAVDQMDLLCIVSKIQEIVGLKVSMTSLVSPIETLPEW